MRFVIGRVQPGIVSYVPDIFLKNSFLTQRGMAWSYKGRVSTERFKVPLSPDVHSLKNLTRFRADKEDEHTIGRFLEEYATLDPKSPASSWASGFRCFFREPWATGTSQAFFGAKFAGAWQSALVRGEVKGGLQKYDLNSAYGWAASLGLPDPRTFSPTFDLSNQRAVLMVSAIARVDHPPSPFIGGLERDYLVSSDEILAYKLDVRRVYWGTTWGRTLDLCPALDRIRDHFTDWKKVLRSFWGAWAARRGPTCQTFDAGIVTKKWRLPNRFRNFVWAHLVISRVKAKVWAAARRAVHVYVDSVITPDSLPTGSDIGEWRLCKEYPEGVVIYQTGLYADRLNNTLEKHCGIPGQRFMEEEGYEVGRARAPEGEEGQDRGRDPVAGRRLERWIASAGADGAGGGGSEEAVDGGEGGAREAV